ncbi:zinc metalloprotease [Lottiidibacillus patelloidae]|uniref:Zinc metalloprotease n=1 Tax=Lottiidibacillus patelloidae TaxID=2670334 RepID=A0A263BXA4_9BACI|nr:SprT family zinc-dependent metalloprotease [Lottiidibacillus patelloidae]OZM58355.1 zinc metalloprotease [Lottiidibacillus patelloidae]
MPSFQFGNTIIEYNLMNVSDTDTIKVSIEWIDGVSVIAPENTSIDKINNELKKKAPWIIDKLNAINEVLFPPEPKEFVSGEKFPYLGRTYRLKVSRGEDVKKATLSFYQGRFWAQVPAANEEEKMKEQLKYLFKHWYIQHGQAKVEERLSLYAEKMDVKPKLVKLKEQKMRWGTCTSDGAIYLNWKVIMAPMQIVDYLLVHELAHLKYPNHSKDFWRLVATILPDFEHRKEWLRVNGPTFCL